MGVIEAMRKQSETRALASHYGIGQESGVKAAAMLLNENQKAIQGAASALKTLHTADIARTSAFVQNATKPSWAAATPRQRLTGQFGVTAQPSPSILDLARRIVEGNQAGVAAAAMRSNPHTSVLQTLATQAAKARAAKDLAEHTARAGTIAGLAGQAAKARTIATMIEGADQMPKIAERLGLVSKNANYGLFGVKAQLAQSRAIQSLAYQGVAARIAATIVPDIRQALEKNARLYRAVEAVAARLEGSALWFVLSPMNMGELYLFSDLEHAEAEMAVLDALEAVIVDGRFVSALEVVIAKAPHITPAQRHHLRHALRHAGRGEFLDAVPPLMCGLEGAFASAARDNGIIDEDRRLLSRPSKKLEGAGSIVKEIDLKPEFRTFLRRDVFGRFGNAFRHGDDGEARRQALLGIVALAGWTDVFMGTSVRAALVGLMSDRLPEAISRQRQLAA
jgi:hypothetical protein